MPKNWFMRVQFMSAKLERNMPQNPTSPEHHSLNDNQIAVKELVHANNATNRQTYICIIIKICGYRKINGKTNGRMRREQTKGEI